jgi:4-hydroxy-tetrahydrodipicolinate reductase
MIPVVVTGAAGRMGREVVRAVMAAEDMQLAGAVDPVAEGQDVGEIAGVGKAGIRIHGELMSALAAHKADVMVDFTVPSSAVHNIRTALQAGVSPVVGTTGLTEEDIKKVEKWAREAGLGAFIAPNFAVGAVLMMQFAQQAARYLPDVEIIELHHENKLDYPSGTALMTAQKILAGRISSPLSPPAGAVEKLPGARGAEIGGIRIHSVRLPGFVAHQEVLFGGIGQTLTIRHDSLDRRSFMPGVLLAVRKVRQLNGLVIGLEHLL